MNLANVWKQSGRISLWRYTENERNYPGWHLNADIAGCHSFVALLDALATDGSGSRTITLTSPTMAVRVPNNRGGRAKWLAPAKLRVTLSQSPADWVFPSDLDPATISVGSDWLGALREGLSGIPKGQGDYSIGNSKEGNLQLWFWW